MVKLVLFCLLCVTCINAKENIKALQYSGVKVDILGKSLLVERVQDPLCLDLAMEPKTLYGIASLSKARQKACTKQIITTFGIVQPISLDPKIKTVAELEVLSFLKKMQKDPKAYLLIDARLAKWFFKETIPGAINLPYNEIRPDVDFPEEQKRLLKLLRIQKDKKGYDFSKAKEILLFCNGSWCAQSAQAIEALVELGYPKEKIRWYRGGLQDWSGLGFTTIAPSQNH